MAKEKRFVIDAHDAEKIAEQAIIRCRNLGIRCTMNDVRERIYSRAYFAYPLKVTKLQIVLCWLKCHTIWVINRFLYERRERKKEKKTKTGKNRNFRNRKINFRGRGA